MNLVLLPDAFRALLHAFSSRVVQLQSTDVRSMSSLATASGRATNRCVTGKLDARYSGCRCRSSAETTRDPTAGRYGAAHGGREEPADAKSMATKPVWRNPAICRPCLNGLPSMQACELRA